MIQSKWLLLCLALALLLITTIAFASTGPQVLFTDNIDTGPDSTVMELALLDRLNVANTSIDAAIYGFNRASIHDALIAADGRGVTVRVVTDDDARASPSYKAFYDSLAANGITVIDDERPSTIMHNKYFILDGMTVWTGSTNITDNGFTSNHNNSVAFDSAELAAVYEADFEQMFVDRKFSIHKDPGITNTLDYNGIPLEIYFSPKENALDEVIAEVNDADASVYFSIFYLTDKNLQNALIARDQAGADVVGVWDAAGGGASQEDVQRMCNAGVVIKVENISGVMHNKFMVIDVGDADPTVVTGSMNWSDSGDNKNDENTVIVHDDATAQAYATAFQDLYEALGPETLCESSFDEFVYLPALRNGEAVPASDVQIASIVYNPDGSDVEGERVVIENRGSVSATITDWTLSDESGRIYTFPTFTLSAGGAVKVWVKDGTDSTTDLFWGSGSAIWTNSGDTATLKDSAGQVVDLCTYAGGGIVASCD